jgi:hypothetical protein
MSLTLYIVLGLASLVVGFCVARLRASRRSTTYVPDYRDIQKEAQSVPKSMIAAGIREQQRFERMHPDPSTLPEDP